MILSSDMLSLISIPSYNSDFLSWIALLPQPWTSFAAFNINSSFNKISIDTRKVSPSINSFSVSGNAMSASHFDIDCHYFQYNTEYNAQNECWKEAISLFEEILKKEIDDDSRTSVIFSLMWLYSWMGDWENAEKTALSQSPVRVSREVLLADTTKDEKSEEYRGEAILALMHELYKVLRTAVMIKHSLSHSQAGLDALLAVVRLYESILADGNCGIFHNDICMLYLNCSSIALHLNDSERALNYYEIALEHFLAFKQVRKISPFTAPLVDKAKNYRPSIVLLDREWFEEHMQSKTILNMHPYLLKTGSESSGPVPLPAACAPPGSGAYSLSGWAKP